MITRKRASETRVVITPNNNDHVGNMNQTGNSGITTAATTTTSSTTTTIQRRTPVIRVRVKKYLGVAHWTWNCGDDEDVCSICQNPFEGVAPGVKYPGDDSAVVFGKCGHAFHLLCVTQWLNTRSTCPFCRSNWEFGAEKSIPESNHNNS